VNRGDHPINAWVPFAASPLGAAVVLDPQSPDSAGVAALRHDKRIYLQLEPGESCIVRIFSDPKLLAGAKSWTYFEPAGDARAINGKWQIHFIEGGPKLPADFQTERLGSWTTLGDDEAKRFAGTAQYKIEFDRPEARADDWMLD